MRHQVRIEIEPDPTQKGRKQIVLRDSNGETMLLASGVKIAEAALLLVALRKAYLAGVQWFRQDSAQYIQATAPNVTCHMEGDTN